MSKHLYNTKLRKVPWFIKRFGVKEIFRKPLRSAFAPLIMRQLPEANFEFRGRRMALFYHRYNITWATERAVEVPIAMDYLAEAEGHPVLEVGNVMSHYCPVSHTILDKFEKGRGIINQDIIGFRSEKRYRLVLSISTLEHIGFDDDSISPSGTKIQQAIAACKALLLPGGKFVATVPIGYNPELDAMIANRSLGCYREFYLKRYGRYEWGATSKEEALLCRYKTPFPYANAVMIAEFSALDRE